MNYTAVVGSAEAALDAGLNTWNLVFNYIRQLPWSGETGKIPDLGLWPFSCLMTFICCLGIVFHQYILFIWTVAVILKFRKTDDINCKTETSDRRAHKMPFEISDDKSRWNVFDLAKTAYIDGHADLVKTLIQQYAYDVNYVMPSNGLSLFLCACLSGDRGLILYMIQQGADVTITTTNGDSALYLATYGIVNSTSPDISVITDLVRAGCGVNNQNYRGYTPLHRAANKGNIPVIKMLLKLGADPYICSKSGIYPIDSALNSGHHEAVELLKIKLANPHVWDVVDPHTPPRITLGLQSPVRRHLLESTKPRTTSRVLV